MQENNLNSASVGAERQKSETKPSNCDLQKIPRQQKKKSLENYEGGCFSLKSHFQKV